MTQVNDDGLQVADVDAEGLASYIQERIHTAWQEPERARARAGAEPMQMYVDLAASTPVLRTGEANVTLLKMEDILYVNKHHQVRQASRFLGSSRPAIPLGLDGPEHTKYRRLLDPVFTARRVAPLAPSVRRLANELIDTFIEAGEADIYYQWCEPLRRRSSCPSWACRWRISTSSSASRTSPSRMNPTSGTRSTSWSPCGWKRWNGSTTTSTVILIAGKRPRTPATTSSGVSLPPPLMASA